MKLNSIIAASVLTVLTFGNAMAAEYPITVIDDRGVLVTFKEKPKNVAALTTVAADVMKAIDEKPIGVGTFGGKMPAYLEYKTEDYIDFGQLDQPNLELMTENKVDLTVGITNYNAPFAEDFEKMGNLITMQVHSFESSFRDTMTLAKAFGKGEQLTKLNDEFNELVLDYNEKTKAGQTAMFIWVWGDENYAYYSESMVGSLIELLNVKNIMGYNILSKVETTNIARPIDAEELLTLNPDVIFAFRAEGNNFKNNPVYKQLKAIKNNRFYSVGQQYSQSHGPIARQMVLKEMAHLLYPDTFEKPDLPKGAGAVSVKFAK